MKPAYYLVFIGVLIVSCSTTPSVIPNVGLPVKPTSTFTLEPTIPPTSISVADLDLETILIQPGDLPAGYSGAQVRDFLPGMFDDIDPPVNQIYQEFEQNNDSAGGVAIIVYDSMSKADYNYTNILWGMGGKAQTDEVEVGDQGRLSSMDLTMMGGVKGMDLIFLRCNTIVHIRMTGTTNQDSIISYTQRLDDRLTPLVCR